MTPGEKLEELLNKYADENLAYEQGRVFYWLEFGCPVDVVADEFIHWVRYVMVEADELIECRHENSAPPAT